MAAAAVLAALFGFKIYLWPQQLLILLLLARVVRQELLAVMVIKGPSLRLLGLPL
jgi:hypothetical protein